MHGEEGELFEWAGGRSAIASAEHQKNEGRKEERTNEKLPSVSTGIQSDRES